MSEAQEKKDENQSKVVGYSKAFTELEELSVLIDYLVEHYGLASQTFAGLPGELERYGIKLVDEEHTIDNENFLIEVSRVHALNDLIIEIIKANEDYTYFTWRDNVKEYLKTIAKLASIWKVFRTTEFPERNVKTEQFHEPLKAVEDELRKIVLGIIRHAYNCNEPEDEEGCCDDEPEESDDDTDYDEEEPEEESDEA